MLILESLPTVSNWDSITAGTDILNRFVEKAVFTLVKSYSLNFLIKTLINLATRPVFPKLSEFEEYSSMLVYHF